MNCTKQTLVESQRNLCSTDPRFNIIFLDVDGVLTTMRTVHTHRWHRFDEECVANLNLINDSVPRLRFVISSCWRIAHELDWLRHYFMTQGLKIIIIGRTPGSRTGYRGDEIKEWLRSTPLHINKFCMIDDSIDMDPYMRRLFRTSLTEGLTRNKANEVIKFFNEEARIKTVCGETLRQFTKIQAGQSKGSIL